MPIVKPKKTFTTESRLSPLKAIRRYCVEYCMLSQPKEVMLCPSDESCSTIGACPLYDLRLKKNPKRLKVLKQIRKKCLDCSGFIIKDVKECEFTDCVLYEFRMGRNPALKGKGNTASLRHYPTHGLLKCGKK